MVRLGGFYPQSLDCSSVSSKRQNEYLCLKLDEGRLYKYVTNSTATETLHFLMTSYI